METQKNRQKNGHGQPPAVKDRDAETGMMEEETIEPIDAQLTDKSGTSFYVIWKSFPFQHPLRN